MTALNTTTDQPGAGLIGLLNWPGRNCAALAVQRAAVAAAGLAIPSHEFLVRPGSLAHAIAGAGALGFAGLSIGAPLRQEACRSVLLEDAAARSARAVDCVVFEPYGARGLNNLAHGFASLLEHAGWAADCAEAVVLGAGASGLAIGYALAARGKGTVSLLTSELTLEKQQAAEACGCAAATLDGAVGRQCIAAARLIVNATPLGGPQFPELSPLPDLGALGEGCCIVELICQQGPTRLLRQAAALGLPHVDGYAVLCYKTAQDIQSWFGCRPDPAEIPGDPATSLKCVDH